MNKLSTAFKVKSAIQIIVGGHVVMGGLATYAGNESWYKNCLMPTIQLFGAETAHWLAVKAAKYKLVPRIKYKDPPSLSSNVFGHTFSNPVGLAAGFDKHGEAVDGLLLMGFGFVEVGSVTPKPQPGNDKPRVFRLKEDRAVINRYGFNSDGHEAVYERLKQRAEGKEGHKVPDDRNILNENLPSPDRPTIQGHSKPVRGLIGVNLGKNKTSSDPEQDYTDGVRKFGPLADYLVINVSSPNTPGLRAMQGRKQLQQLIDKVLEERQKLPKEHQPPILIKIAPDLSEEDKIDIAAVVCRKKMSVDGLIISNTTITRPNSLQNHHKTESGGLSGAPLRDLSTQTIRDMYRLTSGCIPIIGVGGVGSGQDAYEKICAGASLIQLYTSMAFDGPPLVVRVKKELADILEKNGHQSISEAVGVDFKIAEENNK